jgi:hypothetical protein
MKRSIILTAFVIQFSFTFAQNTVTLYDQCNFGGRYQALAPGNYRGYQLGIGNDKLSSIRIPAGLKVTLYEHDNYAGRSVTYAANITCLPTDWNKQASSVVVESEIDPNYNENDYVVFYNDCYSNGYSRTLRPGKYTGAELAQLKQNISSFTIYGNLQVKAYLNNDNLSGYSVTLTTSQLCLSSTTNDKIASLIIEYKPYNPTDPGNTGGNSGSTNSGYVTFFANCNYEGNAIRLGAGRYEGDNLGMFRNDISSMEIPSDLRVRVYINSDYLTGTSYTLTESSSCLSSTMNNKIASILVEPRYGGNNPGTPGTVERVTIYTDTYYGGQSSSLLPGNYSTMSQAGFPDDALSSLQLPAGYRVILYENPNFGGKSYTITASKSMFTISGWNDKTSSIKVIRD